MTIDEAQADIRRAYVCGGPGVAISGLVWLATAWVDRTADTSAAFAVLFFGGMLIFPVGALVTRRLFGLPGPAPANPLGGAALESTIAMIAGLFAAWLFLPFAPGRVLPLAAIAVGTHYAVFRTVYGDRRYWLLGACMTAIGLFAVLTGYAMPGVVPLAIALVELAFAAWFMARRRPV